MTVVSSRYAWAAWLSSLACACAAWTLAAARDRLVVPDPEARRLEVLFLGSENRFNHEPVARFRVIRKALGREGINFTYAHTTSALTRENLAHYDVLLIFANHETIAESEKEALLGFARGGGGCVLLHCAAGCFRRSQFDGYVELLGAQFRSHGEGVFRAEIVAPEHPLMKHWEGFECWDETYEHQRHGTDRTILQRRDGEPWTWVKTYGEGRVFYTASGHDHRCWDLPAYHELIRRAVRWTAGGDRAALLDGLNLPELEYRPAAVPKDPDHPVGPNNELQLPLPPEASLKLAQIPVGFELQLFAGEPQVVNPIAINWDARGRLWLVEAFDYPHKVLSDDPQDRIKILEDTDGDGRADQVSVFAEGLNLCTSVLPRPDGAIATDGENMVYLRDTDGDDRADTKEVIFSGIQLRDTHACVSNLRYGVDDWIYATVGYSGLRVHLGGREHASESGVFRFRADGSDFEILQNTTNNTWGLGFTEEHDVVGSTANGNPSWFLSIPNRFMIGAGLEKERTPRADSNEALYPITTDYFQNNPKEKVSSGAGHAVYTARRFPSEWWNRRAFVCEPPLHLVAAPSIRLEGTSFKTGGFEQNLYASADAWSAPVAAEVGPDGAVWIADWYNPICNHNPYRQHQKRGPGNAFVSDDRDRTHGRIYRVFPRGTSSPSYPNLRSVEGALAALKHANLFWRLSAQATLLADGVKAEEEVALISLAEQAEGPASAHALRVLKGGGSPEWPRLARAHLASSERLLAEGALDVLPRGAAEIPLVCEVLVDEGRAAMTRKKAAFVLAEMPPDIQVGEALARLLLVRGEEAVAGHLQTAVGVAAIRHPEGFIRHLVESGDQGEIERLERFVKAALRRPLSPGLVALVHGAKKEENPLSRWLSDAAVNEPRGPVQARPLSESGERGREVYLSCIACHQPDGGGLAGTFPPLNGSPRVTGDPAVLVRLVLKGLQGEMVASGRPYNGIMPGHETQLSDREIADVLSYVRQAWENGANDVSLELVEEQRAATAGRDVPWTIEELEDEKTPPSLP